MQHGVALSERENPERPLSPEGRRQIETCAKAIARLGLEFDLIVASTKKRSIQTAAIVADATGYRKTIEETDAIKPSAEPEQAFAYLEEHRGRRSVLIAGHLPSLAKIASALLSNQSDVLIEFKNGGLCRIDLESVPGRQSGTLCYCLTPIHLALIAG